MKIEFSEEEIKNILLTEASVMVDNYHIGKADITIDERFTYIPKVSIDVVLKPYEEPEEEVRKPKRSEFEETDGTIDHEEYEEVMSDYEDDQHERKRDMDIDAQLVEGELEKEKEDE